jgi:chaperone BCS1
MKAFFQKMVAMASNYKKPDPQLAMLDFLFPGFSSISSTVSKCLGIDLNVYIPMAILLCVMTFLWRYLSDYAWGLIQKYFMARAEVRNIYAPR